MASFTERIKRGWNAFVNNKDPSYSTLDLVGSNFTRPDRVRMTRGNDRSIVTAIYNRIAVDAASISIEHVRVDENENYLETIKDPINDIFNLEANVDQSGRDFVKDIVLSMFDEGCVALVPIDTSHSVYSDDSFDIYSMRTGKITEWFAQAVRVQVYNDRKGIKEEIILPKSKVAIIENPFYAVMNEPNSTAKRLIYKLALLDKLNADNTSGKLDLIIQLPYVIKTEARRKQAESRRKDIEMQLAGSKYGIAYTDGTEHITQLNRPIDNNLQVQIDSDKALLYSQLGITEEIMNGSASEEVMLNYYTRTIEPVLSAITDGLKRRFLTKTARTQGQSFMFFRDPFKLVPVSKLADIADRFTRNEILSSNEMRGIIGYKPVDTARANELSNKNMPMQDMPYAEEELAGEEDLLDEEPEIDSAALEGDLDDIDSQLDELERLVNE